MSGLLDWILAVHAGSTLAMAGLIWFVQIVHYPMMAAVGPAHRVGYEHEHMRRTSLVVGPLMLIEIITAILLVFQPDRPDEVWSGRVLAWVGLGLVGVIWWSTAMLQVPMHRILSREWSDSAHRRLVSSNWIRTIAWSIRGAIALRLLI